MIEHDAGAQSSDFPNNQSLRTFLVCGMTGAGKSTFINKVTGADLSVSHRTESDTAQVIEDGIPLIKHGAEYIQLVDTPGFGDSRESSETVVLRRITEWLAARYVAKTPVTGVICFRPILNVRVDRLEKALIHMFKDLCGEECHDHIILVTTRWNSKCDRKEESRELELASRDEYFGSDGESRVRVRRLNDEYTTEEARDLVRSFAGMSPVTFRIQREIIDEDMSLGETEAGLRIGADLDERIAGLEEKARKANKYVEASMKKLEAAEEAKDLMEKEKNETARKAIEAQEAAEGIERELKAAKEQAEKERVEADEKARKAEADAQAARVEARRTEEAAMEARRKQQVAEDEMARMEKEKAEFERKTLEAEQERAKAEALAKEAGEKASREMKELVERLKQSEEAARAAEDQAKQLQVKTENMLKQMQQDADKAQAQMYNDLVVAKMRAEAAEQAKLVAEKQAQGAIEKPTLERLEEARKAAEAARLAAENATSAMAKYIAESDKQAKRADKAAKIAAEALECLKISEAQRQEMSQPLKKSGFRESLVTVATLGLL